MKTKLLSSLLALTALAANASGQWTLQERTFDVDTIFHATVGPGTTQTSIYLTGPTTLHIFYTTTDVTNPNVEFRSVIAQDKLPGGEIIPNMASRKSNANQTYFAGVNADFFQTQGRVGEPVSTAIVDSEIYLLKGSRTYFSVTDNGDLLIDNASFSSKASANGTTSTINGINIEPTGNRLVLFTERYGAPTGAAEGVYEVALKPTDSKVTLGSQTYTVSSAPSSTGNMTIPAGECVLSGAGTKASFVSALNIGDEVTINTTITIEGETRTDICQSAGGLPIILQDGEILNTETALDHLTALNPRTAIGFNEDRTKLIMLVVDGRGASAGVVSKDLAAIMKNAGASTAMNFDGGGSSSLYVNILGVRNRPSDGSSRAVANGVFAVAPVPEDNMPATIEFRDKNLSLPQYSYYTPVVYAYNQYGVLIDTDFKGYTLSCDESIATPVDEGKSLFCNGTGYKALTATYNGYSTSTPISIVSAEPRLRLESAVVDPYNDYVVEVVSDINGVESPVENTAIEWSSEDPSIATVDESGRVHGIVNGTVNIHGKLASYDFTLPVTVNVPETRYRYLFKDAELSVKSSGIKTGSTITENEAGVGFDLDFTISSTRGTYITAATDVDTWAIPDSIRMSINPGTATITKLVVNYVGIDGRTKTVTFTPELVANTTTDHLFAISDIIDRTDRANFPINFTGFQFYLSNAASSTHTISVKSLYAVYDNVAGDAGVEAVISDEAAISVMPNPAAKGETVTLDGIAEDANYEIFSTNGALIERGTGNTIQAPSAPGIYLVKVGKQTLKLIVK